MYLATWESPSQLKDAPNKCDLAHFSELKPQPFGRRVAGQNLSASGRHVELSMKINQARCSVLMRFDLVADSVESDLVVLPQGASLMHE